MTISTADQRGELCEIALQVRDSCRRAPYVPDPAQVAILRTQLANWPTPKTGDPDADELAKVDGWLRRLIEAALVHEPTCGMSNENRIPMGDVPTQFLNCGTLVLRHIWVDEEVTLYTPRFWLGHLTNDEMVFEAAQMPGIGAGSVYGFYLLRWPLTWTINEGPCCPWTDQKIVNNILAAETAAENGKVALAGSLYSRMRPMPWTVFGVGTGRSDAAFYQGSPAKRTKAWSIECGRALRDSGLLAESCAKMFDDAFEKW